MKDYDDLPMMPDQKDELRKLLPNACLEGLTYREAARLIKLHNPNAVWRNKQPTEYQQKFLVRYRFWRPELTRGEAADLIGELKAKDAAEPGYLSLLTNPYTDPSVKQALRNMIRPG